MYINLAELLVDPTELLPVPTVDTRHARDELRATTYNIMYMEPPYTHS